MLGYFIQVSAIDCEYQMDSLALTYLFACMVIDKRTVIDIVSPKAAVYLTLNDQNGYRRTLSLVKRYVRWSGDDPVLEPIVNALRRVCEDVEIDIDFMRVYLPSKIDHSRFFQALFEEMNTVGLRHTLTTTVTGRHRKPRRRWWWQKLKFAF